MTELLTRRTLTLAGAAALIAGPALAKPGHIRRDLYAWEGGKDPTLEFPASQLSATARIAPKSEPGQPLLLSGRVTSWDRNAPVAGVIVYAYQTDIHGVYQPVAGVPLREFRMRLRGWAKTGADGRYAFETIKPGMYPSRSEPAHIHMHVFEPGKRPYWIDSVMFYGDEGVTRSFVEKLPMRGGGGMVSLGRARDGTLTAARDIRLERHPA